MTREKSPPAQVLQKAYAIMHRYGIDIRKLERVDQTCGGLGLKGILKPTELIRSDALNKYILNDGYDGGLNEAPGHLDDYQDNQVCPNI